MIIEAAKQVCYRSFKKINQRTGNNTGTSEIIFKRKLDWKRNVRFAETYGNLENLENWANINNMSRDKIHLIVFAQFN